MRPFCSKSGFTESIQIPHPLTQDGPPPPYAGRNPAQIRAIQSLQNARRSPPIVALIVERTGIFTPIFRVITHSEQGTQTPMTARKGDKTAP